MKDFLILVAKIALGLLIGFSIIFGGASSLRGKADNYGTGMTNALDTINFESTNLTTTTSP
ncbi:hypothetical protein HZI73_02735 [Vallitalea pronyensis]|uniref:Uncharacterized protein n=1 Tax=Vallitalea pronyensis TaxID=1348613 RepID=A0A8J8MHC3_9FIRM|nr:hypothetical protein [Vallitalea pronyensis]QUI21263.1 hypothetical protein HZI73_02735 [Vallitalea pronyensis]